MKTKKTKKTEGQPTGFFPRHLAKRTKRDWSTVRKIFAGETIPPVGISKARYAHALSRTSR